ncbi:MAG: MFS transporter [Burkholderiales bacterium]|nr:MFS transporter [Burkholderiales bacterium]
MSLPASAPAASEPESPYAWARLAAAVLLSTVGGVGMWSVVVALPAVQLEFGAARAGASFPYTMTMLGFAAGGIFMGRMTDRFGIMPTIMAGTFSLGLGYILSGYAGTLWEFALIQGVLIGAFGSSATFGPLLADTSRWFTRRRGIAVAICASGNYVAGTLWPPIVQHFIETEGWRQTQIGIGIACIVLMLPLALVLRRPPPSHASSQATAVFNAQGNAAQLPTGTLQTLLIVAGISCCVAMSMPQVHIVAYCGDLGYGVARGAEMLSLMLGFGIFSRLASGFIADRIGGVWTLLLGSTLQGFALLLYLLFDGLTSLYVISALFGLFQGGIVPMYAIIVREYFPASEAGTRVGLVLMSTLLGMALGGWMSGAIFDLTGSYRAAFVNGIAWNLVNVAIIAWLARGPRRRPALA